MSSEQCRVLIVGGGPAGLAAALELHRLGVAGVRVLEREAESGGTPRLCHHTGFGLRDLRRVLSGPDYARRYRVRVQKAGIDVQTESQVTGWQGPRAVSVTSPRGLRTIQAEAILLATGCRERPASARLIPGDRPAGVLTTGSLQRFVYEQRQCVGRRAVIVGAELVSLSAALTLAHTGVEVVALVTEHPHHQVYTPYTPIWWMVQRRLGFRLLTQSAVRRVIGHRRVEAVEIERNDQGTTQTLVCDTLILSGGWIPEHELARLGGLTLARATRGPQVDSALRTSAPGVFAAGNLLRGAQTADEAALEGRYAARQMAAYLNSGVWPQTGVALAAEPPLAWVCPSWITPGQPQPPQGRMLFQVQAFCRAAEVSVYQGRRRLYTQRHRLLIPNRSYALASGWTAQINPTGEAVRVTLG
ncbi:MAG: FAD-dependent oxidoreductase [Caldilineaceae bacterium]|nr:FAD-dependent oxidoreductase [Caldilineaceae bacterium]